MCRSVAMEIRRPNMFTEEQYRSIKAPCLVVWTSHDPNATPDEGRQISEMIPGARYVVMNQCGQAGALRNAFRGEDVDVAQLVLRGLEVGELDVALVDQRLHAKVDRAEADAKLLRDLALRCVGAAFEQAQDPEMHVLALLCDFVTSHGIDRRGSSQRYRTAGEPAPSVTCVSDEHAGASRSFLNT